MCSLINATSNDTINAYLEEQSLKNFRFRKNELPPIANLANWSEGYANIQYLYVNSSELVTGFQLDPVFERASIYSNAIV